MIAYKDVGSESATRDNSSYRLHMVEIFLACIFTVHELQYLVASALYREVDMLTDVWLVGNSVKNVFAHILRVRGGEAHTHIWHLMGYHAQ